MFVAAVACAPLQYTLRTVKVGLVAPLSGPAHVDGQQWVLKARDAVWRWNTTVLAGRPYRIELVIYDAVEGTAVARRLSVDPEVIGAVMASPQAAPEDMAILVPDLASLDQAMGQLLDAVTQSLGQPAAVRREAVRAILGKPAAR